MNITEELISKAKTAASAEELLAMAKEEGIELSAEDAEKYFAFLSGNSEELPDEALDAVAGGKGSKIPDPKFRAGQKVRYLFQTNCFVEAKIIRAEYSQKQKAWYYVNEAKIPDNKGYVIKTFDFALELPVFRTVVIG